jgi:hypothetical protein
MGRTAAAAAALPIGDEDPVLAALMRAPLDDLPESEEERQAVAAAKTSRRMKPHAAIEAGIEDRRKAG